MSTIPKFYYDDDTVVKLNAILELKKKKIDNAQYENIEKYISDIKETIVLDMLNIRDTSDENFNKILSCTTANTNEYYANLYAEALATGLFLGFLHSINSDRKSPQRQVKKDGKLVFIDKEKGSYYYYENSIYTDEKNNVVPDEVISKISGLSKHMEDYNVDFGYNDMDITVKSALVSIKGETDNSKYVDTSIEQGLFIKFRTNVSSQDYFLSDEQYYVTDIDYLYRVVEETQDYGYNLDLLNRIKLLYANDVKEIETIYKVIFEDGFGINPYSGVFATKKDTRNGKVRGCFLKVSPMNTLIGYDSDNYSNHALLTLAKRLFDRITSNVKVSTKRQFDYDEIIHSDKTVYFPLKILEYALGKKSTLNLNTNRYLTEASASSWPSYWSNYVEQNVKDILARGVYYIFEDFLKNEYKNGLNSPEFLRDYPNGNGLNEFIDNTKLDIDEYGETLSKNKRTSNYFNSLVYKIKSSMTCCYILTKYNVLNKLPTLLALRISDINNLFEPTEEEMKYFYSDLISVNPNEKFSKPFDLSSGATFNSKELATNIYEFRYDYNPVLTQAEPLFGYVVHKMNQKRGVKSSWNKILYGQSPTGKEIYSGSGEAINLNDCLIHNIYAGSRSGKGVMTMNTLAAALADGKPIFYIDRKPDICGVMHEASNGTMFVLNGGQTLIKESSPSTKHFDPYNDTSDALTMFSWRKIRKYLETHSDIAKLIDANIDYPSYGDLAYFRAILFVFGIMAIRNKLTGTSLYEEMNGNNGIVLIIDELTNFNTKFSPWFAGPTSNIVQAGLGHNIDADVQPCKYTEEELLDKIAEIEADLTDLNNNPKAKEKQKIKAKNELKYLRKQLRTLKNPSVVYAQEFYKKVVSSVKDLSVLGRAGWNQAEYCFSDVFVLGQELSSNYLKQGEVATTVREPVFFPALAKNAGLNDKYKNFDPVRSLLETFGSADWFLGRNDIKYGDTEGRPDIYKYKQKSNWDYVGKERCETILENLPVKKHVQFKSFLVLNNTKYGNGTLLSPDSSSCVGECKYQCGLNSGGIDIWPAVVEKHSDDGKEFRPGVGFEGMVLEAMKTVYPTATIDELRQKLDENYAKSGDLANMVAKKMGYDNWADLIFDFSPYGLFSIDDMLKCFTDSSYDFNNIEVRLPLFAKYGIPVVNIMRGEQEPVMESDEDEEFMEDEEQDGITDIDTYTGSSDFSKEAKQPVVEKQGEKVAPTLKSTVNKGKQGNNEFNYDELVNQLYGEQEEPDEEQYEEYEEDLPEENPEVRAYVDEQTQNLKQQASKTERQLVSDMNNVYSQPNVLYTLAVSFVKGKLKEYDIKVTKETFDIAVQIAYDGILEVLKNGA